MFGVYAYSPDEYRNYKIILCEEKKERKLWGKLVVRLTCPDFWKRLRNKCASLDGPPVTATAFPETSRGRWLGGEYAPTSTSLADRHRCFKFLTHQQFMRCILESTYCYVLCTGFISGGAPNKLSELWFNSWLRLVDWYNKGQQISPVSSLMSFGTLGKSKEVLPPNG